MKHESIPLFLGWLVFGFRQYFLITDKINEIILSKSTFLYVHQTKHKEKKSIIIKNVNDSQNSPNCPASVLEAVI